MKLLNEPCAIVITGKRGSGKTSLGYLLVEKSKYENKVVVLPEPDSIAWNVAKQAGLKPVVFSEEFIDEMPEDSMIMLDESSVSLYARDFGKDVNKLMIKALAKSRQMEQSLLFISHDMAGLDIGVLRGCDSIFLKEPGHLNVSLDRGPFKKLLVKTNAIFKKIPKRQRVKYVYINSGDGEVLAKIGQAKFWCNSLSLPWRKVEKGCDVGAQ